jgi:hypothetical protein
MGRAALEATLSTGERKAAAGGKRTDGACRSKVEVGEAKGTTGGGTVEAEERSAADAPNNADEVRGSTGESTARPPVAERRLILAGLDAETVRAGRRGRRPPAGAGTFEFASEAGKREEAEAGAVTVNVRDLGILLSKEKQVETELDPWNQRKKGKRQRKPSRSIKSTCTCCGFRIKIFVINHAKRVYSLK